MALFFDAAWFDAKLAAAHLSRGDLARALGLGESQIAEMWKDQRELSAREVSLMAGLLGVTAEDVAAHAGISTPVPGADLDARLARIERTLEELKLLVRELKREGA
ncbi:MAG: helix-turn-helix transcriptional regulator [Rhizomicrobium sp.]